MRIKSALSDIVLWKLLKGNTESSFRQLAGKNDLHKFPSLHPLFISLCLWIWFSLTLVFLSLELCWDILLHLDPRDKGTTVEGVSFSSSVSSHFHPAQLDFSILSWALVPEGKTGWMWGKCDPFQGNGLCLFYCQRKERSKIPKS